jgi:hypothetical protein
LLCSDILLLRSTQHLGQPVVGQGFLQRSRLVPRRAHPNIVFFGRHKDHRHGFGVNRRNDGIGWARQEGIN